MSVVSDQFQLSSDFLSESLADSSDFDNVPVDTANPGFASLLTVLKQARAGQVDTPTLEAYYNSLALQLEDVRVRMDSIAIPEGFEEQAEQAFAATFGILDQMAVTLEYLGEYLNNPDPGLLDEGIAILSGVHQQMRDAVHQIG